MPIMRNHHNQRAAFQREMAASSATAMERNIHHVLAAMHTAAADAPFVEDDPAVKTI